MKKENQKKIGITIGCFLLFILWTIAICVIDRQEIGPRNSVVGFAVLGLVQLIKRRSLCKVDSDILVLGGFYIIVFASYILFEMFAINYRPVLIDGYLEASYPSSTTLLVMCVMPTTIMQFQERIKNEKLRKHIQNAILAFTVFMVIGRLVSGVHWFSDIIGGVLLSAGLVMLYDSVITDRCQDLRRK